MKIETAIGFNSNYMVGHVTNDLLTLKRFCDSTYEIRDLTKNDLDTIIKEFQKIYSLMHSNQKATSVSVSGSKTGEMGRGDRPSAEPRSKTIE